MNILKQSYRQMAVASISAGLYSLGTGAMWFVLPIFANQMLNSVFLAASVIAIPNIVSLIFDIPIGKLSDKVGRKKLIAAGLLINVLLGAALHQLVSVFDLVLFMILLGFGTLLIAPPSRAFIMEISPSKKSSEFFGIFETMIDFGYAVGPLIAGYILAYQMNIMVPYIGVFTGMMCVAAFLVILLANETVLRTKRIFQSIRQVISADGIYRAGIIDFRELRGSGTAILLSIFIFVFIDGVIWAIEPLYVINGLSMGDVGIILMMFQLPLLVFQIPAGKLADKYGKITLFAAGILLTAISFTIFGISKDVTLFIATAFLAATGLALAEPAIEGLLTDITSKKQRGGIVGVWGATEDTAYIISPVIGGFIAQNYGIGTTFIFLALLIIVSLPIMRKLLSDRPKSR